MADPVEHADLTGSDLHESKGADSASINTVAISDGAGSTTWSKIGISQLDSTSVKNTNKWTQTVLFGDIGTAGSIYVPVSTASTLVKVTSVVQGAPTTTDTVITFTTIGGSSLGTGMTIGFSGAAAGDIDTFTPSSNQNFAANSVLKITTDGGAANSVGTLLLLDWTLQ